VPQIQCCRVLHFATDGVYKLSMLLTVKDSNLCIDFFKQYALVDISGGENEDYSHKGFGEV
jgi:hypothetical protein